MSSSFEPGPPQYLLFSLESYIFSNLYLLVKVVHCCILVPGIGGSQLQASLHRARTLHWWCDKKYGWYTLWLNIEEFLGPPLVECWTDDVKYVDYTYYLVF